MTTEAGWELQLLHTCSTTMKNPVKVRTSCSGVTEGKEMWQQSGGFTLWAANKDFPDETRASQATVSTMNTPQQLLLWLRQRSPPDVLTLNLFSLDTKKSGAKTRSIYLIRITNFYLRKLPPIMTKKDYFGRALYNGVNIVLPPLGNEIHSTVRNLWVTQVCQGSVWFTSATLNQQNTCDVHAASTMESEDSYTSTDVTGHTERDRSAAAQLSLWENARWTTAFVTWSPIDHCPRLKRIIQTFCSKSFFLWRRLLHNLELNDWTQQ